MCRLLAASAILENVQFSLKACWDLELLLGYYIASFCNPFVFVGGGGGSLLDYLGVTLKWATNSTLRISYLPIRSAVTCRGVSILQMSRGGWRDEVHTVKRE